MAELIFEDGVGGIILEDGSGNLILEDEAGGGPGESISIGSDDNFRRRRRS